MPRSAAGNVPQEVIDAALGEARWGAGRGLHSLVYLTVGTGVGGGALADGRIKQAGFSYHEGPELFRPIVEDKLESVGATRSFNDLMRKVDDLPLLNRPAFDLNAYVTEEALDGLFLMLAREEQRIRTDPLARTTELLRKWFGLQE